MKRNSFQGVSRRRSSAWVLHHFSSVSSKLYLTCLVSLDTVGPLNKVVWFRRRSLPHSCYECIPDVGFSCPQAIFKSKCISGLLAVWKVYEWTVRGLFKEAAGPDTLRQRKRAERLYKAAQTAMSSPSGSVFRKLTDEENKPTFLTMMMSELNGRIPDVWAHPCVALRLPHFLYTHVWLGSDLCPVGPHVWDGTVMRGWVGVK